MLLEEIKTLLNYDPLTGVFTWKVPRTNNIKIGDIAGCLTKNGYRVISINDKPYKAHRLAWLYVYGKLPKNQIDHINHNKDDNRIVNLREVDSVENGRNRSIANNNKSGVTGVHWDNIAKQWKVQIKVKGEQIHLGYFHDFTEAVKARKEAEHKYNFHENLGGKKC